MSKRDWRLLQAYLATGLTPEQIEELKAAAGLKKEAEGNGSNQHISSPKNLCHCRCTGPVSYTHLTLPTKRIV